MLLPTTAAPQRQRGERLVIGGEAPDASYREKEVTIKMAYTTTPPSVMPKQQQSTLLWNTSDFLRTYEPPPLQYNLKNLLHATIHTVGAHLETGVTPGTGAGHNAPHTPHAGGQ